MRTAILFLPAIAVLSACDFGYPPSGTGGAGGGKSTSSAGSTTAQSNGSTNGSTTNATTNVSASASDSSGDASSSSTGVAMDPLYAYERPFPLTVAQPWKRVSFAQKFGTDPNIPKDGITAAVQLQLQPLLLIVTSDNMVHRRSNGVWSTVPMDALFPAPPGGCPRDNNCASGSMPPYCNGIGPAATALSSTSPRAFGHVATGGTCTAGESVNVLGPTVATVYSVAPNGMMSFVVQRDYKVDCSVDNYGPAVDPIWDFEIFEPNNCQATPPDPSWVQLYTRMTDGYTRRILAGDISAGTNSGIWLDDDPNNTLFNVPAGMPERPDPAKVVAAYFDPGQGSKTGTIVMFAPY